MALCKDYTFKSILVKDCYMSLRMLGENERGEQSFALSYRADKDAEILMQEVYTFTPDYEGGTDGNGYNFKKQAYDALKAGETIPAKEFFADATDC